MIVKIELDPATLAAQVANQDGTYSWSGPATPYVVQWMAGRRTAFFLATDTAVLSPSGLVGILSETEEKF